MTAWFAVTPSRGPRRQLEIARTCVFLNGGYVKRQAGAAAGLQ